MRWITPVGRGHPDHVVVGVKALGFAPKRDYIILFLRKDCAIHTVPSTDVVVLTDGALVSEAPDAPAAAGARDAHVIGAAEVVAVTVLV